MDVSRVSHDLFINVTDPSHIILHEKINNSNPPSYKGGGGGSRSISESEQSEDSRQTPISDLFQAIRTEKSIHGDITRGTIGGGLS